MLGPPGLLSPRNRGIRMAIPKEFLGVASAILYGATAIAMAFVNKAILSVYKFKESNVLLLLQMVGTLLILAPIHLSGIYKFEAFTLERAKALAPVSFFYNANVAFALASLESLNVPMYNTLKRLTPAIILVYHYLNNKPPSRQITVSVLVTVGGCLVAGAGDLSFDLKGYLMAAGSCLLQAAYLICVQTTGAEKGIDSATLLEYNAILSIPPLVVISLIDGEMSRAIPRLQILCQDVEFNVVMVISLGMGVLLNYALFWCTQTNSALTTTIVGVLKGVFTTILGFFLLGGVVFNPLNVVGICMNTAGGVWYTYIGYAEKQAKKAAQNLDPRDRA